LWRNEFIKVLPTSSACLDLLSTTLLRANRPKGRDAEPGSCRDGLVTIAMPAQPPANPSKQGNAGGFFMFIARPHVKLGHAPAQKERTRPAGAKPTVTRIALLFWALLFLSLVAQIGSK
jgi:hypothetical protein